MQGQWHVGTGGRGGLSRPHGANGSLPGLPALRSQGGDGGLDSGTERMPSVGEVGAAEASRADVSAQGPFSGAGRPAAHPAAPRPPACLRLPAVPAPRAAATLLRGVPEAGGQTCLSFPPSVAHRAGEWPCRRCGLSLRGGAERADARPALAAVFPRRLLGGLPAHGALCPLVSGESGLSAIRPWAGQPSDLPCDHGQGSPAQVARPGRTR